MGRTGTAISIVGPSDIGNLYLLRLTYKVRPIEKQLPTEGELKTRAELDVVELFEDAFGTRPVHPEDLALARRLLTHVDAEKIVAGLMRDHLGAREATGTDVRAEASEARRAKNPSPVSPSPSHEPSPSKDVDLPARVVSADVPRRERDVRRNVPRNERGNQAVKTYASWEPRAEKDDDEPLLVSQALERPAADSLDVEPADFVQLFVNVGKREGARPGEIERMLESEGIPREGIGRIRVRDRMTFVGLKREHLERAIAGLTGKTVGGRAVVAELAKPKTT